MISNQLRLYTLFVFCQLFLVSNMSGQFQINGDASNLGNDCYSLTDNAAWESGTIFSNTTINLEESFTISGTYNFGDRDQEGADGIVFIFATENQIVGDNGGYLGFQSISPSFGWEVDDFHNPTFDDPPQDHMSIMQNGSISHNSIDNLTGPFNLDNIEDGEDHYFCINWDAATLTFSASLDGENIDYVGDIVNDIFNGNEFVYYGFSSATGTRTNPHTVCIKTIEQDIIEMEDVTICKGQDVILQADPSALSYTWDYDSSLSSTIVSNPIANPIETTTYNVKMNFGCGMESDEVTVFIMPKPEIEIITYPSCNNSNFGSIDIISAINGITYSVDYNSIFNDDIHYDNLSAGNHVLEYLDENGCIYIDSFTIEIILPPDLNLATILSCNGLNDGSLVIDNLSQENLVFSIDNWLNSSNQLVFSGLNPGSYILDILDENGCYYQRSFIISEIENVDINFETTAACTEIETGSINIIDDNINLQFSIDNQLDWNNLLFHDGLDIGAHILYFQTQSGCLDSLIFDIESASLPDIFIYTNQVACEGTNEGSITVTVDDQYLIAIDNGQLGNIKTFTDLSPGNHIIYIQIDNGCILEFPVDISEIEKPNLIINTEPACFKQNNGSAEFSSIDSDFNLSIIDPNGSAVDSLNQLAPGEYFVVATHILDCEFLFDFEILELDQLAVQLVTDSICFGTDDGTISIQNLPPNNLISFNGSEFTNQTNYTNLPIGAYTVSILDSFSCLSTFDIAISSHSELEIEIPVDSSDCFLNSTLIIPNIVSHYGNVNYLWNDGSTNNEKFIDQSELISLSISDLCSSKEFEFEVNISDDIDDEMIFTPNIFSPNGDHINDCFQTHVDASITINSYSQSIFDRWGNKVFVSDDINYCWDGTFNGKDVEVGVYAFMIEISAFQCGAMKVINKVGDVTVIR